MVDYIAFNLSNRMKLEDVAGHLYIKMEEAKHLLKHSNMNIQDIAIRLGIWFISRVSLNVIAGLVQHSSERRIERYKIVENLDFLAFIWYRGTRKLEVFVGRRIKEVNKWRSFIIH